MGDMDFFPACSQPLGTPLPASEHAISVSMPRWEDVVGYEENSPAVLSQLKTAYPRFLYHPIVHSFHVRCQKELAQAHEMCVAFPSCRAAQDCVAFLGQHSQTGRVALHPSYPVYCVIAPIAAQHCIKRFWQHSGLVISSRFAQHLLEKIPLPDAAKEKSLLRERIASLAKAKKEDVYLFPSGMAAIYTIYHILADLRPQTRSVQFGFPYVDTLKIQEIYGKGVQFINYTNPKAFETLEALLQKETLQGVFCEFPTNPLLQSIDLQMLSALTRQYTTPLVVDDTISTWYNADLRPFYDVAVTSLTKFFSGTSDVLAGCLILNATSPHYTILKAKLEDVYEDLFFAADAFVLEENSRDFIVRLQRINQNTETLCDRLKEHPLIDTIYYPKYISSETYLKFKNTAGGYGGLFSVTLKNKKDAEYFYNVLDLPKGPSLGANFTLVCPYTLLAHYHELDFVEQCGISRYLIRVSVGLEAVDKLTKIFYDALEKTQYRTL